MSSFNKIYNHYHGKIIKSLIFFSLFMFSITIIGYLYENPCQFKIYAQNIISSTSHQQPQNNTSVQSSSTTNPINSSFQMSGPMSSFISTPLSNWVVDGNWTLKVENGNLSDFSSNMTWYPTNVTSPNIKQHTHSFSNFKVEPNNQNISLGANNVLQIKGVMDIGAGLDRSYWKSVPAEIKTAGNTITITLDDSKTGHHFNNYSVFGRIVPISNLNNNVRNNDINKNSNDNNIAKQIHIQFDFDKNPISRGKIQTLHISTFDQSTNSKINNMHISGVIVPPSEKKNIKKIESFKQDFSNLHLKNIKIFKGTTDSNGQFTYAWKLNPKFKPGTFTIITQISGVGYNPITNTTIFKENKK